MKKMFLLCFLVVGYSKSFSQVKHVATEPAKIRNRPEPIGEIIGYIQKGDTVLVTSYKGGYWCVRDGNVSGFVSELYFQSASDIEGLRNSDPNAIKPYQYPLSIRLGMTKAELVHIIGAWTDKNTTTFAENQIDEQLIYRIDGEKTKYYYFTNDKLTAIQD